MASFYTVKPEEQSVELLLGEYMSTGGPGLNFAPWPVVTREVIAVTSERNIDIGTSRSGEKAPEVTRKRLYLETMESVLGGVDIILLDEGEGGGQGVVPYLPLNDLRRNTTTGGSN